MKLLSGGAMTGTSARPALLMTGAYPSWDMEVLERDYTLLKLFDADNKAAFIAENARHVRAIATRGDLGASSELMRQLPNLEVVSVFGVGTDAVDLDFARKHAIKVTNTPDVLTDDVADIGVALLLGVARKIPQGDQLVRNGQWPQGGLPLVTKVSGKKVGIAGMGRIGAAMAKRMAAFDCEVSYFARAPKRDLPYQHVLTLVELAQRCEFLIVTLSGGDGTKNIINADVLGALGPDGILVNVSRGSTVDEPALIKALQDKTIKAAGLDVFWNEPNVDPRFFELDNVVLHPHHASGTVETRRAMGQLVRDNLAAHFAGQLLLTEVK
jgi:lactate dehydrogenase-like 2-hydroxyacid dehydrogenase